jgi:PHD/YefM family antitoxin component YafN of YafNO toxin-antitoxin module
MQKVIGAADFQKRAQTIVGDVAHRRATYVVTQDDRPVAALISYGDYLTLQALRDKQIIDAFDRTMARMATLNADVDEEELEAEIEAAREELWAERMAAQSKDAT